MMLTELPNNAPEEEEIDHRTAVGEKRRKKTESRIIETALHIFGEKGPDAPVINDFIKAAGISRGTFYNYFNNTSDLLVATSTWLTDDLVQSIESEVLQINDPVVRHGVGLRLWLRKARTDLIWCRFIARTWFQGGYALNAPLRDIREALEAGDVSCPSAECAWDMTLGTVRQAMIRMLQEPAFATEVYANQIVGTILTGIGASPEKRQAALECELPEMRRPLWIVNQF